MRKARIWFYINFFVLISGCLRIPQVLAQKTNLPVFIAQYNSDSLALNLAVSRDTLMDSPKWESGRSLPVTITEAVQLANAQMSPFLRTVSPQFIKTISLHYINITEDWIYVLEYSVADTHDRQFTFPIAVTFGRKTILPNNASNSSGILDGRGHDPAAITFSIVNTIDGKEYVSSIISDALAKLPVWEPSDPLPTGPKEAENYARHIISEKFFDSDRYVISGVSLMRLDDSSHWIYRVVFSKREFHTVKSISILVGLDGKPLDLIAR